MKPHSTPSPAEEFLELLIFRLGSTFLAIDLEQIECMEDMNHVPDGHHVPDKNGENGEQTERLPLHQPLQFQQPPPYLSPKVIVPKAIAPDIIAPDIINAKPSGPQSKRYIIDQPDTMITIPIHTIFTLPTLLRNHIPHGAIWGAINHQEQLHFLVDLDKLPQSSG